MNEDYSPSVHKEPLVVAQSEILKNTPVVEFAAIPIHQDRTKYLGRGQDGLILQVDGIPGQTDWRAERMACKIFWSAHPQINKIAEELIKNPQQKPNFEKIATDHSDRTNSNKTDEICASVAGFVVGSEIEPNFIDARVALITFNGQAIGYLTPFTENAVGLDILQVPGIRPVLKRLENAGVVVDIFNTAGDNAIQLPDGTYKIIDLSIRDQDWKHHPRNLRPGEIRIGQTQRMANSGFYPVNQSLEFSQQLTTAITKVTSEEQSYSYEDQVEGKAMVLKEDDIREVQNIHDTATRVAKKLEDWELPPIAKGIYTLSVDDYSLYYYLSLRINELGDALDCSGKNKQNFSQLTLRFNPQGTLVGLVISYYVATDEKQPRESISPPVVDLPRQYVKEYNFEYPVARDAENTVNIVDLKAQFMTSDLPVEFKQRFEQANSIDEFCQIAAKISFEDFQKITTLISEQKKGK